MVTSLAVIAQQALEGFFPDLTLLRPLLFRFPLRVHRIDFLLKESDGIVYSLLCQLFHIPNSAYRTMFKEGLLSRDLAAILHALRKVRNKAVHENYSSVEDGKTLMQMAYGLCEWFMMTYGDWNYQHQPFVMPQPEAAPVVVDKEAEKAKEEALVQEAEETAASAEKVESTTRRQRAQKAASQRVKSEAETRYMIDEQLRKVGWKGDTENLRYAKGTRPMKGHNMAIAEWPTKSEIGKTGYAD